MIDKTNINFYWSLYHVKTSQTGISTPFDFEIKKNYFDILKLLDKDDYVKLNLEIEKISEKYQNDADDIIDMVKNIIYSKLLDFQKDVDETIKKYKKE